MRTTLCRVTSLTGRQEQREWLVWFQLLIEPPAPLTVLRNTATCFEKHLVPVVETVQNKSNTGQDLAFQEELAGELN